MTLPKLSKKQKLFLSWITGSLLSIFFFWGLVCNFHFELGLPLYYGGDVMFGVMAIKSLAQNEWFPFFGISSQAVGAPYGVNLGDFPSADNLHFLIIKLFSFFSQDPFVLYNAYYLFGFMAAAVSLIYVAHRFRLNYRIGIGIGVLYSLLPFHLIRYCHLFLASYYLLPLMAMVLLWTWHKKPLLFQIDPDLRFRLDLSSRNARFAMALAFISGMAGIYYAFFFCFFLCCAGISAYLYRKTRYHLYSAISLIAVVATSLGLCGISNAVYISKHGKNTAVAGRSHKESEIYGLKLANIFLPRENHRLAKFRELRERYSPYNAPVEGFQETLGVIALLGCALLLGRILILKQKHTVLDKLSILWLNGVVLASVGGFAVLFAGIVSSKLRCYNRISVFLALFGLLAMAFISKESRSRVPPSIWGLVLFFTVGFGVYDQVTPDFRGRQDEISPEFASDRRFFQAVEKMTPPSSMILQVPYMPFPESPSIGNMEGYSHFKGHAHTNTLSWSYGSMQGRPGTEKIETVSKLPLNLDEIRAMGYRGIYIDRAGFQDHGVNLEKELIHRLRTQPVVSENQRLSYFLIPESA